MTVEELIKEYKKAPTQFDFIQYVKTIYGQKLANEFIYRLTEIREKYDRASRTPA